MYKATLTGFQSIRYPVTFEIKGLTVVGGESNLGKSALVRLLYTAFSNKAGTNFINIESEESSLQFEFLKNMLVWKKTKKDTIYEVNGVKISKPGRGFIPEEVLNLGFRELRTTDKNKHYWPQIQFQGEEPFILKETGSVVAELLGSSVQGDQVYRAIKLATADYGHTKARVSVLEEEKQKIAKRLTDLEKEVSDLNTLQIALDELERQVIAIDQKHQKLTKLYSDFQVLTQDIQRIEKVKDLAIPPSPDLLRYEALTRLKRQYDTLQQDLQIAQSPPALPVKPDLSRYVFLYNSYEVLKKIAQKVKILKDPRLYKDLDSSLLKKLHERWVALQGLYRRYQECRGVLLNCERDREDLIKKWKTLQKERDFLMSCVRDLDVCPVCERPLPEGFFTGEGAQPCHTTLVAKL